MNLDSIKRDSPPSRLWHWLTEPSSSGDQADDRNTRALESLLAVSLLLGVGALGYALSAAPPYSKIDYIPVANAVLLLGAAYWLARRGHRTPAAVLTIGMCLGSWFLSALLSPKMPFGLCFLCLGALMSGFFLSSRATAFTSFVSVATVLGLPAIRADIPVNKAVTWALLSLSAATLALIAAENRRQTGEQIRRQASDMAFELAEREQAEESLRAAHEYTRSIVDSSIDMIIAVDRDRRITEFNRAAQATFGYSLEEIAGQDVSTLYADPPESRQICQALIERGTLEATVWNRRKSGEVFPSLLSASLLRNPQGENIGYMGISRDITERRQAERELSNRAKDLIALNTMAATISQAQNVSTMLQAALEQITETLHIQIGSIHVIDSKAGELTLASTRGFSEEMIKEIKTLRADESILGQVMRSQRPTIVTKAQDNLWSRPLRERQELYPWIVVPLVSKEKTMGVASLFGCGPRATDSQGLQFLAAFGNQVGVAIQNLQLTESAAEAQALRELDHLRSQLVANVSHELRTPLGLIKLFCTTLLREDVHFPESEQRDFLAGIEKESDRLETHVDNLLDLSRIQSERFHLNKHRVDLNALIQTVVADMQAQNAGHHLIQELTLPLTAIADLKRIEQVVSNLIGNAIKYSPPGSTISVRGIQQEERILIQVRDQGIGIAPADLRRVFERFYRVDNEVTRRVRGVGLGLAICQGIVEAHGGSIWAESAPGRGSTFSFTLPISGTETPPQ